MGCNTYEQAHVGVSRGISAWVERAVRNHEHGLSLSSLVDSVIGGASASSTESVAAIEAAVFIDVAADYASANSTFSIAGNSRPGRWVFTVSVGTVDVLHLGTVRAVDTRVPRVVAFSSLAAVGNGRPASNSTDTGTPCGAFGIITIRDPPGVAGIEAQIMVLSLVGSGEGSLTEDSQHSQHDQE